MRPGDRAFVITNVDFTGAGASAWPEGTCGFDNGVTEEDAAEFAAASAALAVRAVAAA